jgi:hypothetical protein
MAKSLLHAARETYSVANAVFAIIKGHLSTFTTHKNKFRMAISNGEFHEIK